MIVRSLNDSCWQFPAGFYGTHRDVQRFCEMAIEQGIGEGNWAGWISKQDTCSVLDGRSDIWVSDRPGWYPRGAKLWRLNLLLITLHEKWPKIAGRCSELREPYPETPQLLKHEISECLWGAMMLLDISAVYGVTETGKRCDPGDYWAKQALSALVRWLPEIHHLRGRVSNCLTADLAISNRNNPAIASQWGGAIRELCHRLGYPMQYSGEGAREAFRADREYDMIDEILRSGAVRRVGDRYELAF